MNRFVHLVCAACAAASLSAQRAPQLTRHIEFWNPKWSPDGRTLVFESTLDGRYSVYTIRADGTGLTRLTVNEFNNEQPTWSPDGTHIAFSSDESGHLDLFVMNADGTGRRRLTSMPGGGYYGASFSPNGRWIVFQGRPDNALVRDRVYVVAADGTGLRMVSDSAYGAEGPRWSADGATIAFHQVPYPKRRWDEMTDADMDAAKSGTRRVTVRVDGTGLAPAPEAVRATPPNPAIPDDAAATPDRAHFAYTKSVDGWAGLYVFDTGSGRERLLAGGAGAGPLGYLRVAALHPRVDTLDTFLSAHSGAIARDKGAYVVQAITQIGARRWEYTSVWSDSAGHVEATHMVRTLRGTVMTELETERATADSASMLVTGDHVTGWWVLDGKTRLYDGSAAGERYAAPMIFAAIAGAKPRPGAMFVAPTTSSFSENLVPSRIDSIRVVRRDTLHRGTTPIPVLVLEKNNGAQTWVDDAGAEVLSRGNAGPTQWWWHIRRGVRPPEIRQQ